MSADLGPPVDPSILHLLPVEAIPLIRRALQNGNLIPFVGAGVSVGAAHLPGWASLLDAGIDYLRRHKKALGIQQRQLKVLAGLADTGQLITAFQSLQGLLGGAPHSDHYRAFLDEQFGAPKVHDSGTLDAIRSLRSRVVVTTNYDALLSQWHVAQGDEMVTWLEPKRILSVLRSEKGIIHLHGRYDSPESVILSATDYSRIVHGPEESRAVARALFHSGVLLFVGTSLDGAQDPHLQTLLEEFSAVHGPVLDDSRSPHFMLVRSGTDALSRSILRKRGIEPLEYGDSFADLPVFIRELVEPQPIQVEVDQVRARFHALRTARSRQEVLSDAKHFIEAVIFPHRKVRVAFAEKVTVDGRTILHSIDPLPPHALHHKFSYPQTLAAWALIEGRIFAYPRDLERVCNFGLLRRLNKYNRVKQMLMATDSADPILNRFLDATTIREKSSAESLQISDVYQHWVGEQPKPHYDQFISVPVPLIDLVTVTEQKEPPEFCVVNIDTLGHPPLLDDRTEALLSIVSDVIALAYERFPPASLVQGGRS